MRILHKTHVKLILLSVVVLLAFCFYIQNVAPERERSFISTTRAGPLRKSVTKSLADFSKARGLLDYVLMFNRIPKSGSEILVLLLQKLQGSKFKHIRLGNGKRMSTYQQKNFAKNLNEIIRENAIPLSFDRIMYHMNFTLYGVQSPTFFSVIRDPFEVAILGLHIYRRKLKKQDKIASNSQKFIKCWFTGQSECELIEDAPFDFSIPYICGQEVECLKVNNRYALAKAKSVVDHFYPVFGVLENLNETLFVLEKTLPLFFKGAQHKFLTEIIDLKHKWTSSIDTSFLSKEQHKRLMDLLVTEYEFYNWVKQRLLNQLNKTVYESVPHSSVKAYSEIEKK